MTGKQQLGTSAHGKPLAAGPAHIGLRGDTLMRLVVDLTKCQGYAQCAFLAPAAFTMHGDEALMYDPAPDDTQPRRTRRAAAACPVQAIQLDRVDGADGFGQADGARGTAAAGDADGSGATFRRTGRIVAVGTSLAGLVTTVDADGLEVRDHSGRGAFTTQQIERLTDVYDRPPGEDRRA